MGASSSSAVDDTGSTDGHVIIGSNADGGGKETGLDVGVSTDRIAVDLTSPSLEFQGFSSPKQSGAMQRSVQMYASVLE